jgi:Polyketide cyclase / dehydrase and lipid transport
MPGVSHEVRIGRPPHVAFDYLADFSHDPAWRRGVLAMEPLGDPAGVGGEWGRQIEVRRVPGRTLRTEAEVVEFAPPTLLRVQRATGPIRPIATYRLRGEGTSTRLRFDLTIELRGARRLALPAVLPFLWLVIRPTLPDDLARLKALVEAEPAPQTPPS